MRNWNGNRVTGLQNRIKVSAYLWGIETLLFPAIGRNFCFQPTYEELKPAGISFGVAVEKFSPTYEELKLNRYEAYKKKNQWFSAYLWGIETS